MDETEQRLRLALERIIKYQHTPRAYRHTKFEKLIEIAKEALAEK
jgi:hypothetical protein